MDTMRYGWLQRFADGAGDGGSEGGNSTTPDAAAEQQRKQTQTQEQAQPQGGKQTEAKKATFDELLKDPEYKREYDKRTHKAVTSRLKASTKRLDAVAPLMDMLGRRYGVDTSDPNNVDYEAIARAFVNDDAMLEAEAEERGMSVEQYRRDREKDARIAQLERQQRQAEQDRMWAAKLAEAETVRQKYPDFDLDAEMENEQFARLLTALDFAGFPNSVLRAYETVHQDAVQHTVAAAAVEETKAKIGEAIRSGQQRPAEGGNKGGQAKPLSAKGMSRAQIEEIRERVARGERVSFS